MTPKNDIIGLTKKIKELKSELRRVEHAADHYYNKTLHLEERIYDHLPETPDKGVFTKPKDVDCCDSCGMKGVAAICFSKHNFCLCFKCLSILPRKNP